MKEIKPYVNSSDVGLVLFILWLASALVLTYFATKSKNKWAVVVVGIIHIGLFIAAKQYLYKYSFK